MLPEPIYIIINSPAYLIASSLLIVSAFFYLCLLALSEKVHVRLHHLPHYFFSLLTTHRAGSERDHIYHGIVIDGHTREILPQVTIQIIRSDTGKIVFHTKTTKRGTFRLHLPEQHTYTARLGKKGYHGVECDVAILPTGEEQTLALLKNNAHLTTQEHILHEIGAFFAFSFETLLLLSIISALLLLGSYGALFVLPFLFIALFNLLLWMLHTIHIHS